MREFASGWVVSGHSLRKQSGLVTSLCSMRARLMSMFNWMRVLGLMLLGGAIVWFAISAQSRPRIERRTMLLDGEERLYRLVIPSGIEKERPVPLLLALHGALDEVDDWAPSTGLDDLANEKRFILAYPQGWLMNWPPFIPDENPHVVKRELRFFDALCHELVQHQGVDKKRIYLVGSSQGGAMVNLLVTQRSEAIAAAICNCGWLPSPLDKSPLTTKNKCPMLFVVGDRDKQVPPEAVRGGHDAFSKAGHPTEMMIVPEHGHGWPRKIDFGGIMWTFLSKHKLPSE